MSYLEHFELKEQPFRLTPDPEFVYWSKQHARAKAYMESTIWLADGFVVVTGEIGSGKTTLLQSFLGEIEEDIVCAVISQTRLQDLLAHVRRAEVNAGFVRAQGLQRLEDLVT